MTQVKIGHDWEAKQWDWPLQHHDGVVKVINTSDRFEVGLEVQYFTPKEIEVKVIGQDLVVHCRHEQRSDTYGSVTREIHRSYHLPPDVDASTIRSHLSTSGVLKITGYKKR